MTRLIAAIFASLCVAGCATGGPVSTSVLQTVAPVDTGGPDTTSLPEVSSPPQPAFDAIHLKGKGKKVAKFSIPEDSAAIAVMTHKGKSNFIVQSVDSSGDIVTGLVHEIGRYSGTALFDSGPGDHSVAFVIDADGTWTITVKPVTAAAAWNPTKPLKGQGDDVYLVSPPSSGLVSLDLTYKGKSNFIVHAFTPDGPEVLANEIGNFKGQVLLPDGTFLIEVTANGGVWTMVAG